MSKVQKTVSANGNFYRWLFQCPGCDDLHGVDEKWEFNGNLDKPTFSPSILVHRPANPNAIEKFKEYRTEKICHSFVRDGIIEFLSDCTHELAGKTVGLPEIEP